ncbi:hypothetical protein Bca4012_005864 [Brassica carinata]
MTQRPETVSIKSWKITCGFRTILGIIQTGSTTLLLGDYPDCHFMNHSRIQWKMLYYKSCNDMRTFLGGAWPKLALCLMGTETCGQVVLYLIEGRKIQHEGIRRRCEGDYPRSKLEGMYPC